MSNPAIDLPMEMVINEQNLTLAASSRTIFTTSPVPQVTISASGWFAVMDYDYLTGTARADVDGDLYLQFSCGGSTVAGSTVGMVSEPGYQHAYTMDMVTDASDGTSMFYSCAFKSDIPARYARAIYVNGSSVGSLNICVMKVPS